MEKKSPNMSIYLLLFILGLLNADQMVLSPNIGTIEKELKITDKEIGYMAGGFSLVGAVVTLVWGFLADQYNRKRLFIVSMLLGQIPCFLSAFASSYHELFFLRALTGLGLGAAYPIIFSYTSDIFQEHDRGKVNTWIVASVSVGAISGMMLAGFMGQHYGWRVPFLIISIPNILLILAFCGIAREPKRGASEFAVGDLVNKGYKYQSKIDFSDYLNLFKIKTNLVLVLQGILGIMPWGVIPYYLIEFLRRFREMEQSRATLVFIFFAIGNVVGICAGGILGGILYRRKSAWMPLFCSMTTFLGAFFVLSVLNYHPTSEKGGLFLLCLLGAISSATISTTGPNVKTMLMNVNVPENRARMFSVFNLTDSLGLGVGQCLGGMLSCFLGSLAYALNIAACFLIPCSLVLFVAVFTLPRDVESLHKKMQENAEKISR